MKILNAMMAALFLTILGASSCATLTPAVVEHEEEITQERCTDEIQNSAEKKNEDEQKTRWGYDWDHD